MSTYAYWEEIRKSANNKMEAAKTKWQIELGVDLTHKTWSKIRQSPFKKTLSTKLRPLHLHIMLSAIQNLKPQCTYYGSAQFYTISGQPRHTGLKRKQN